MTDPLSIAASIITVVTTAKGIGKTLNMIKNLSNAPDELLALMNEVSDLTIILDDAESLFSRNPGGPLYVRAFRHLGTLLQRAKDTLLQLDQLIEYQLVKPRSTLGDLKISRSEWIKSRKKIEGFRQRLRDIRLNIVAQMSLVSASYQSRIGLVVDEIRVIAGQLQAQDQTIQQLVDQSRLRTDVTDDKLKDCNVIRTLVRPNQQKKGILHASGGPPYSFIGIRASILKNRRFPCFRNCKCACHALKQIETPDFSHKVIGALFMGYSGYPSMTLKRCNLLGCQGQRTFQTSLIYIFPLWFFYKAISISFMIDSLNEIAVSLKITRYVDPDADVLRFAFLNDVEGLRRLFSIGAASPNDVDIGTGFTPLTLAVNRCRLEACKFLLDAGADARYGMGRFVNAGFTFIVPQDLMNRRTPPHTRAWYHIFENSKDQGTLATLRDLFPADEDHIEEWEFSELHQIVLGLVSSDLAKTLSNQDNHISIDARDSQGTTPLMWAARRGDCAKVDLLLKSNADPRICNQLHQSALLNAVRSCSRCANLLLQAGADPTQKDNQQFNALHYAMIYSNDGGIVQYLIDAGAEVNGRNVNGLTPLACANYQDNAASARVLLDNGADPEVIDSDGHSILYKCLYHTAHGTSKLLLERGISYTSFGIGGGTILHVAAQYGTPRTLEILHAASLKDIDPDALNHNGKSPSQLTQEREDVPETFPRMMQELLADIRVRNASRRTPDDRPPRPGAEGPSRRSPPARTFVSHLAAACQHPSHVYAWTRSITWRTWKSILLYWLLGLGWVGFVYELLEPRQTVE